MACFWPIRAWTLPSGVTTLREPIPYDSANVFLRLPCGGCIGCRKARAREWALRCTLELAEHDLACWCTLTYDEAHVPPSLSRGHLSGFLKRLRKRSGSARVRFFASGEYGEQTQRPHYHAILYGVACGSVAVQSAWPFGFARVDELSPAAISYVAGYCSKKVNWKLELGERVDVRTGELYEYQPPFIQMSRRPGIGGSARRFKSSWRHHAVLNGSVLPVPRFLHKAWLDQASEADVEALAAERLSEPHRDSSRARLLAGEQIAISQHELASLSRVKI